jgi:hypothetical protein
MPDNKTLNRFFDALNRRDPLSPLSRAVISAGEDYH